MNVLGQAKDSETEPTIVGIVGIGASAGGLKSIEALFDNMPSDTGLGFVIIQHLSPDFKSLMSEILSRHTSMSVVLADKEMSLQSDHVYVIPPGKELRVFGDTLAISDLPPGLNRPIDTFFKSLSENPRVPSVGIILSGTGSDGAEGIRAIHSKGGLTIAESGDTAQFDGMPVSAERTGCVHHVLRPAEIPHALVRYLENDGVPDVAIAAIDLSGVRLIFSLIEQTYGLRFDQYKPTTITRRIERRQTLGNFDSMHAYADHVESDPVELDALFHDLLIGVTKFFRDEQAFLALEAALFEQVKSLPSGEVFRVWCVGCATGQEPYSVAMILLDAMDRLGRQRELKVFATDVHQGSLDHAARGEYDAEAIEFVSNERREKYFDALDDGRYRVKPTLRKHLVFAKHDAIGDPSFTNIHLVTCRNVLIYFQKSAQDAALASMHYSLVKGGSLFLGSSETLGDLEIEFANVDRKWRIFRKIRHRVDLISKVSRVRNLPTPRGDATKAVAFEGGRTLNANALLDVYDTMIRAHVKMGLLLDKQQNVIHVIGDVAQNLKSASGRFRGTIGDFLDPEARSKITAGMIRAQKDPGTHFIFEDIQPDVERPAMFRVTVVALEGVESIVGWTIQFESTEKEPPKTVRITESPDQAYGLLESELEFTKESLNASIEEMEAGNQELQATNEEMIASNEELQSTNEELHSVNEELHSVNAELNRKINELEESTNDLEMLLGSSDVGTVFLDSNLRVRRFTQAICRYFHLVPHDVGRSICDFSSHLGVTDLPDLLRQVIRTGEESLIDTFDDFGDAAFVKIVPYVMSGQVCGAVLTVVRRADISPDRARLRVNGNVAAWDWPNVNEDQMWWSDRCYQMLGLSTDSPASLKSWRERVHPNDLWQLSGPTGTPCHFASVGWMRIRMLCADETYRQFEFQAVSQIADDDQITGMSGVVATSNLLISEHPATLRKTE